MKLNLRNGIIGLILMFEYRCMFCAGDGTSFSNLRFENDVKMYGTQTLYEWSLEPGEFENDVKMYGTQTKATKRSEVAPFENDVKMYGTQT